MPFSKKNTEIIIECLSFALFFLLVICSIYVYCFSKTESPRSGFPSNYLSTRRTEEGNKVITDYIDEEGNIAFATDKLYARSIRIIDDGYVSREEFYDENNNPSMQKDGYYSVIYERDEKGRVITITFLGIDGEPILTNRGYTRLKYVYNDKNQRIKECYCDINDLPVSNSDGCYGVYNEYDENNRKISITYLDADGNPANCNNGYSKIIRTYNDSGKIEYEYYFDALDMPAMNSSGYYGIYRQYDEFGNIILTTYLDSEGSPMLCQQGYASFSRSYNSDGSVSTVRFFDEDGNPVSAGRNQYGIEYINGKTNYLDKDGKIMFRIDNYLITHPVIVFVFGILLTLLAMLLKGISKRVFIVCYVLFILVMTIAFREVGSNDYSVGFFISYSNIFTSAAYRQEIINNIWLFVPLGVALNNSKYNHLWLGAVGLSIIIELLQLIFGLGYCELDDVINNSLGAIIGYGMAMSNLFQYIKAKVMKLKTCSAK